MSTVMSNFSKTMKLLFNITEEKNDLLLESSEQSLSVQEFDLFLNELKLLLREKFRKRIKLIFQFRSYFNTKIKQKITAHQLELLNKYIREEFEHEKEAAFEIYQGIYETIRCVEMDDTTHVEETNVKLFKLVSPQWNKIIGPQRNLIPCKMLEKIFDYNSLSNFKKREYSSYCVILQETLSTFLKNCKNMKDFFTAFNLQQEQITLNVEQYKIQHYTIESPKNITNLTDFIAEIKFDGDRLLVARSCCSSNLHNWKYFPTERVPCNWIFVDNNGKPFKKMFEYFPIETCLDSLFFPMICACKAFKYDHEYEKNIEVQIRKNTKLLENLLLEKKKDAILSDFAFNINVEYSNEMIELEKSLVRQYFEIIFPKLHGHEMCKAEMLSFQGDIEGVFDLFPTNKCATMGTNQAIVEYICKKPCIVFECTFAYNSNPRFNMISGDKQKDMLKQIKQSITEVREKDQYVRNVLVVQDLYSIANYNLTNLPLISRMEFLDKMSKNPKSERVSPSYRKILNNEKELKEFMIESKNYSSSAIILRHITDNTKVYSLKTKCCVDLILLAMKLKKGDLSSIFFGVVPNQDDYIWFNKIGIPYNPKFTARILCVTKSIPNFLINDLYTMYDNDCFHEKQEEAICNYSNKDKPSHFLKQKHRFVVELEGHLKIFDKSPETNYLLLNPNGMILEHVFVRRRRNDKTEKSANTLFDLMKIYDSIKFTQ